ncbi:hypothetical protein [Demequina sp. NBRC 110056]|uniref:hypothetical protein n=1 Tax=Demequina sp. NBRC 110056 TaxID=1570345 RepID=UPI0009FD5AFB|nr:hypothetical protein [Demequina sp. NBRC 110056]
MAEFRIARRAPVAYVGLPVETTLETLPADVGAGFEELDRYVEMRGIDLAGPSLLRYRDFSYEGTFTVEVGLALSGRGDRPRVRDPFVLDELAKGHFAVAEQRGPYAWIGGLTRELMTWGESRGMDYAVSGADGVDTWECWYEWYPEPPVESASGLEGPVEVCLLLRA